MSDFLFVDPADLGDKLIYRIIFNNAYGTAAESAACDAGTDHARDLPCQVDKDVDLFTGYFVVVAKGYVGLVHKLSEFLNIAVL